MVPFPLFLIRFLAPLLSSCSLSPQPSCSWALLMMNTCRTSYAKDQPFSKLLNDAMALPLFDGGNVGVRRRQLEKIFQDPDYQPWAATFGE